jgi:hypothetical protein
MSRGPWTIVSLALIVIGVGFHLAMGLLHSSWTDVGVYSITATFVGFGIGGLIVSGAEPSSS